MNFNQRKSRLDFGLALLGSVSAFCLAHPAYAQSEPEAAVEDESEASPLRQDVVIVIVRGYTVER